MDCVYDVLRRRLSGACVLTRFGFAWFVLAYVLMLIGMVAWFRHAATYVDNILKKATSAELPVEQRTKYLAINLKTPSNWA